jgi:Tol biopolymer transport system component
LADTVPVDISPDGKEILAVVSDGMEAEKLLWILPLSGTPRPANGIRCHDAAWSPNRSRSIAYATGNDIFLTSDEGKSSTKLGTFPPYPTQIAWSADGSQLRFLTYDSGTEVLKPLSMRLRQDSKGSPVVKLSLPKECCNSWSKFPYGPFFFATSPNSSEVWVSREDNLRNQSPIRLALDALQAPLIVATAGFDSKFLVMSPAQQIFELLRFSVKTRDFAPFAHTLQGSYVDFSPDGKRMAYARISDHALFVSTADGQQPRQLTFGPMVVELPRWSPDGRQIAFTAKLPDRPWRIFIVSQAGGVPYEASSGSDDQGAPTWSPDGRSLIYANIECHESSRCGVHRIELGKKTVEDLPRSAGFRTARWSPDGKFVAALRADTHGLWLFDFKKNDWSQVADDANEDDISWSRDSRFIYYSRSNANGKSIARLSLHTKQKETALDLSAFNSINGDFSSWFCLTPENSIIILRQLEASEIYAVDWVQR